MISARKKIALFWFFPLLLAHCFNFSQPVVKHKILVSHTGKDLIGSRVAYELKEKLTASQRYELIKDSNFLSSFGCAMEISIVSIDGSPPSSDSNLSSVLSVAYIFHPNAIKYFSTHIVVTVGSEKVQDIAASILALMDKRFVENFDDASDIYKTYGLGLIEELKKK